MAQLPASKRSRFVVARSPRVRVAALRQRRGPSVLTAPAPNPVVAQLRRTHALALARQALRRGEIDEAEREIERGRSGGEEDPAFLNVLGILHECRGDVREARACYGKAIAASATYAAAQQNMRRLYELDTYGRTNKTVRFGDEAGG